MSAGRGVGVSLSRLLALSHTLTALRLGRTPNKNDLISTPKGLKPSKLYLRTFKSEKYYFNRPVSCSELGARELKEVEVDPTDGKDRREAGGQARGGKATNN